MVNRNVVTLCLLTIFWLCSPNCAITSLERAEGRILGGAAAVAATPHRATLASIRFYNLHVSVHVGGGFIINRRWVGTAAQNLEGKTVNNCLVVVGSMVLTGGTSYNLDRIAIHEDYNVTSLANDVAVLRTDRDIVVSANVQFIRVAHEPIAVGRAITIFGWGSQSQGGAFSNSLMFASFTIIDYNNCVSRFPHVTRPYITDRHICTTIATAATCGGDAGGPLVVDNAVYGIASWVEPCTAGQTNVNMRMTSYANWISNHTSADD